MNRASKIFKLGEIVAAAASEVITIRIHAKRGRKWPKLHKKKSKKRRGARWRSDKEKGVMLKRGEGFGGKASIVHRKQ